MIDIGHSEFALRLLEPGADGDRLGSRYSHSGYIHQAWRGGRPLLGMPFEPFDVFHGEGFPDEFEQPIGYEAAAIGEGFVKIGVGVVEKNADHPYTNHDRHRVVQPAEHAVRVDGRSVTFEQSLDFGVYGYRYRKSVSVGAGSSFRIAHRLTNSGSAGWQSFWYSHVFLPRPRVGEPYHLELPPCYRPDQANAARGAAGRYALPPAAEACFWWAVPPGERDAHQVAGTAMSFACAGDYPVREFMVYQNPRVVSPEPRLSIALQPGASIAWASDYRFEEHSELDPADGMEMEQTGP